MYSNFLALRTNLHHSYQTMFLIVTNYGYTRDTSLSRLTETALSSGYWSFPFPLPINWIHYFYKKLSTHIALILAILWTKIFFALSFFGENKEFWAKMSQKCKTFPRKVSKIFERGLKFIKNHFYFWANFPATRGSFFLSCGTYKKSVSTLFHQCSNS